MRRRQRKTASKSGADDGVRFPSGAAEDGACDGVIAPVPEPGRHSVNALGRRVPVSFGIEENADGLDETEYRASTANAWRGHERT